ncbi:TasA family protein [Thermococcus sp. AM4]|uniref:TasA family protein n=1 Tax=Thermococcus sp. (strain AM4) TaxID=246969 RepID=UPI00018710F2|nr:TasA family protein [Thermococcus sp. AM4]EEB73914.1 methyltransferase [Thermococcus sp. AM4]
MKRYLIVGIATLLVFLAGVHLGTSYFSDVAKSSGNEVSTGDFDIAISKDGKRFYDDYKLFSFGDLAPGENRTVTFAIKNRGDYPLSRVILTFNVTDREEKISKAESLIDSTPDVGELSKYLVIKSFVVSNGSAEWSVDSAAGKTLAEINGTPIEIFTGKLPQNGVLTVNMTLELSPSAGNDCLTDSVEVDMTLLAEQWA